MFTVRNYDIVYVFLWVTPFGPPVFERIVRGLSKQMIYDIDDLIYSSQKSKNNPVISGLKGTNKPVYLFKKADHIITSTEAIEEFASKLNENVSNIPVSINTDVYRPKQDWQITGLPVLGWSGSLSTSPYMHLLDAMLLKLRRDVDFKLVILGDPNYKLPGVNVEALPWSEAIEVPAIRRFDIGLYPLPDEEWVHGKGGGKALQYMALGVSTVATKIGMNVKIIEEGHNGFLVNTDDEWIGTIKRLIGDVALRKKIGLNGIRKIEDRYSIEANKSRYFAILDRLTNR